MGGPAPEVPDAPATRRAELLRATLCGSTLLMVGLSWPLWLDLADFPAIPFVRWYPENLLSSTAAGLGLTALGLGLGLTRRLGRIGVALAVLIMGWLAVGDQLRLQPWVYQFLAMGTSVAILPPARALTFARLYLISVYFYSGLSKLDASFLHEMGPLFVRTLSRVTTIEMPGLLKPGRGAWMLVMPGSEIVVAILLMGRSTRVAGVLGAVAIHAILVLILGPWGLRHSTIVLLWNVAMAAEVSLIFRPTGGDGPGGGPWSTRDRLVGLPFAFVLAMPLAERSGLWDSWPSHALYASHCERSRLYFRAAGFEGLPDSLRIAAVPSSDGRGHSLNPTDWTRASRGVPAYPQRRYLNGLAEWFGGRDASEPDGPLVRVEHEPRADLLTGRRRVYSLEGPQAIRDEGDRFRLNAHPLKPRGR